MNVTRITMMTIVAAITVGNVLAKTNSTEVVEIVDGGMKWRFVPVVGTSRLPLDFMRTGENREQTVSVTMPKFWIAEKMVTEGEFAALMGRKVREGRNANETLAGIEWEEALDYCEKFTQRYSAQMPINCIASMPTMIEWAHAVKLADARLTDSFKGDIGTYLFTRSNDGGFLHTLHNAGETTDLATDLAIIPKRASRSFVGLRIVLVDMAGGQTFVGRKQIDNTIVSRGVILVQYGIFERAKRFLRHALAKGILSADERERVEGALAFAEKEHEHDFEDWSGLVFRAAAFAEKRGFLAQPFARMWAEESLTGSSEDTSVTDEYRKRGIVGEWRRIGDLPPDVRKGQCALGRKDYIFIYGKENEEPYKYEYTITDSNLVQVLRCDFTGDGREDMVVENFCSTGSYGYNYSFYEAKPDGTYKEVEEVQLVGLCVLPRKTGKGCGFIVLGKVGNPVLTPSLYVFKGGKLECEDAARKPFYMLDAEEDRIYMMAPFIGAGYGIGWKHLESGGHWFRPVYWPWKQGEVQGYKEAVKKAKEVSRMRKDPRNGRK